MKRSPTTALLFELERARRQAASRSTVLSQVFGQVQMVITAIALAIAPLAELRTRWVVAARP